MIQSTAPYRIPQQPYFIKATDTINLAYYTFLPKESPTTVIIFYHGSGVYTNKTYQWIGHCLKDMYSFGAYFTDLRGHGYSQGSRGDTPTIEQVWQDVDTLITFVHKRHPTARLYLVGHSSGSGIIINYCTHTHDTRITGLIFLAPYLGPRSGTARKHSESRTNFIKSVRNWVYIVNNLIKRSPFQHTPTVFFNHAAFATTYDPLLVSSYTYTMSCATTPYNAPKLFADLKIPFALLIGDHDEQFIPEKVIAYREYASHVHSTAYAKIVPDTGHISILLSAPALIAEAIGQLPALTNNTI